MAKPKKKPCAKKSARPTERVHTPVEFLDAIQPGVLLNLKGKDETEASYKLGTLWVWTRTAEEHYLVQTSHVKHCHRVHGVFWTATMANAVRRLIENGMKTPGDLAVYMMLRNSGILPLTQYRPPTKRASA